MIKLSRGTDGSLLAMEVTGIMNKKCFIFMAMIFAAGTMVYADSLKDKTVSSLLSSLKCEQKDHGKILGAFRDLEKQKAELDKVGIKFSIKGEDMDERIQISFIKPIDLYGAKTNRLNSYVDGADFIVYGDFKGDPKKIIEKLELKQDDPGSQTDFVYPTPPNDCDGIKRLRKTGHNKFRFGCGWCNG